MQTPWPTTFGTWQTIRDGDPRELAMLERHYPSRKYRGKRGRNRTGAGPGEKLVLLTTCGRAIFIWHRLRYRVDQQQGLNCSTFRNEGAGLSSGLILQAEARAWQKWPEDQRLFTFVDPGEIASPNPGYCFKQAGWTHAGHTKKRGLVILEKWRTPAPGNPGIQHPGNPWDSRNPEAQKPTGETRLDKPNMILLHWLRAMGIMRHLEHNLPSEQAGERFQTVVPDMAEHQAEVRERLQRILTA